MISQQRRYRKTGSGRKQEIVRQRKNLRIDHRALLGETIDITELDHLTLIQLYRRLIDLEGTAMQCRVCTGLLH